MYFSEDLRIYNLFPDLVGSMSKWHHYVKQAADMGFTAFWINPFWATGEAPNDQGQSGSNYAIKTPGVLDKKFSNNESPERNRGEFPPEIIIERDLTDIKEFTAIIKDHGMRPIADLVLNHLSLCSPVVNGKDPRYPGSENWFRRTPDGKIDHDRTTRTVWSDVAPFDFNTTDLTIREKIIEFLKSQVDLYIDCGFTAFRCDAPGKIPTDIWKNIISHASQRINAPIFIAETVGVPWDWHQNLEGVGFSHTVNSVYYTHPLVEGRVKSGRPDGETDWFDKELASLKRIAPSIGFPCYHDSRHGRFMYIMENIYGSSNKILLERENRMQYAKAALLSDGVFMPIGFEGGYRNPLNVFTTSTASQETDSINLRPFISEINTLREKSLDRWPLNSQFKENRVCLTHNSLLIIVRYNENSPLPGRVMFVNLHPEKSINISEITNSTNKIAQKLAEKNIAVAFKQNIEEISQNTALAELQKAHRITKCYDGLAR
ncbi:MAG: hypothetical protein H6908_04410 [Hyphomicrobiales bacterium]|nr:hypothetical protein [Hyphomicrobiales bacterium]